MAKGPIVVDVGTRLREIRKARGKSLAVISGLAGISPSYLSRIAETVDVDVLPSPTRRCAYYREYGRALARLPKRRDDAVLMLRRAEAIAPARIHRNPLLRSVLAELLTKAKRDAVGRELRGMAYRSGLHV